ncbi:MAG: DNA polymerase III subunit gamma/tau [Eubacterium sp.]|jgi:DNA polymerase-3 subunit gamma/tau|nr:DNA polymerase III subunit gamma/tau [Eubacterium sp.]
MYQALYRKYRPAGFSDVKGQEHIVTTLVNQIQGGRIGHAYLFCGTRGTGKTTVAKIFARAVNCENPGPEGPCGECAMCRAIQQQASMNVVEIDAASNNRVDDIRQVIDEVQYSPAEGRYKVYIIDEVHMLSVSAFNALLKTLEEPPSYLIFILATTEAHKIPLTILSRCQRYDFRRIGVETIAERLQELLDREGIEAEDRALAYIARQADGALRDGLSLLEQCISFYFGQKLTYENVLKVLGAVDNTVYHELMGTLVRNKVEGAVELIARVVEQGKDLTQFVNEFVWYLRNLLIVKTTEETGRLVDMSAENIGELQRYAQEIEVEMIFRYIRVLSVLAGEMRYGSNKRVMLEVALIRLCRPQMERDYDSLVNRLHILEQRNEELLEAAASGKLTVAAPDCAGGSAAPESEKEIRPEAVPEDVKAVVANWKQLLGRVSPVARKMLEEVRLSVSDSGLLILAFPQSTTAEYFRREDNQAEVVEAAAQLTGKEIHLDVRLVESRREMNTLPELRNIIKNVEIEILD